MNINNFVDFDNEVQEEIKQCLMDDILATTKTSSIEQAKEFVYNTFVPDGLMNVSVSAMQPCPYFFISLPLLRE